MGRVEVCGNDLRDREDTVPWDRVCPHTPSCWQGCHLPICQKDCIRFSVRFGIKHLFSFGLRMEISFSLDCPFRGGRNAYLALPSSYTKWLTANRGELLCPAFPDVPCGGPYPPPAIHTTSGGRVACVGLVLPHWVPRRSPPRAGWWSAKPCVEVRERPEVF